MKHAIKIFVDQCHTCQVNKVPLLSPASLLKPKTICEEISLDFIDGLPMSYGSNCIVVLIDQLRKFSHFIPLNHLFIVVSVAEHFVKEIVRLHGMPVAILSNWDKIFTSAFWRELFQLQGTTLQMSSSYHPQTDSQTEVVNRGLETYLCCFTSVRTKSWSRWLHWAEFSYSTAFHTSIQITHFKAVYRHDPP